MAVTSTVRFGEIGAKLLWALAASHFCRKITVYVYKGWSGSGFQACLISLHSSLRGFFVDVGSPKGGFHESDRPSGCICSILVTLLHHRLRPCFMTDIPLRKSCYITSNNKIGCVCTTCCRLDVWQIHRRLGWSFIPMTIVHIYSFFLLLLFEVNSRFFWHDSAVGLESGGSEWPSWAQDGGDSTFGLLFSSSSWDDPNSKDRSSTNSLFDL